jgi:hypothetical protein
MSARQIVRGWRKDDFQALEDVSPDLLHPAPDLVGGEPKLIVKWFYHRIPPRIVSNFQVRPGRWRRLQATRVRPPAFHRRSQSS